MSLSICMFLTKRKKYENKYTKKILAKFFSLLKNITYISNYMTWLIQNYKCNYKLYASSLQMLDHKNIFEMINGTLVL